MVVVEDMLIILTRHAAYLGSLEGLPMSIGTYVNEEITPSIFYLIQ